MNKNDLIAKISEKSGVSKAVANKVLDAFTQSVTKALKSGEEVRLVGFGTFTVQKRKATTGRNPRTGNAIKIPASNRPKLRFGSPLIEAIN